MTNNSAFLKNAISLVCASSIAWWFLTGCAGTEPQDTPPPKTETMSESLPLNEYAEAAVKKLGPHLGYFDEKAREEIVSGYRKIYIRFLERYPDQPKEEKVQALMEMTDETINTLNSKDFKDKKCVVDRDFLAAEIMPLLTEIEGMYKRQLSHVPIGTTELSSLKEKVKILDGLDKKIAKLCRPFKDTLRLLNNEARLDAGYVLNGGSAPGRAIPDQDSEVDELLNDESSSAN